MLRRRWNVIITLNSPIRYISIRFIIIIIIIIIIIERLLLAIIDFTLKNLVIPCCLRVTQAHRCSVIISSPLSQLTKRFIVILFGVCVVIIVRLSCQRKENSRNGSRPSIRFDRQRHHANALNVHLNVSAMSYFGVVNIFAQLRDAKATVLYACQQNSIISSAMVKHIKRL